MMGFTNGILMLKMLKNICMSTNKIIMIQESWVTSDQLCYFDVFENNYHVFGVSAMDATLGHGLLRGRPKGGAHIFVHESLESLLGPINCISCAEKYVIVSVGKLILINVYLPSVKSKDDLNVLHGIFSEMEAFLIDVDFNYLVIAGDFNCNVLQNNTVSQFINNWMNNFNLTLANNLLQIPSTIKFTFSGKSREAYSHIDHFYVSKNPVDLVRSIINMDADVNFSDHIPIALKFDEGIYKLCKENMNIRKEPGIDKSDNKYETTFLDWENSSKLDYYNLTRIELNSLSNLLISDLEALKAMRPDIFLLNGLNDIYRNVVHVLYNASLKTIKSKNKISHNKYWCDHSLNEEKRNSKK